jgi:hypothetical protein
MLLRHHIVVAVELADHDVDRTVEFHCSAPVSRGELPVSTYIPTLTQFGILINQKESLAITFFIIAKLELASQLQLGFPKP